MAVFRGIPFAEPPVGALRFAAPRPVRGMGRGTGGRVVRTAAAAGPAFGMDALHGGGGRRLADDQRLVARAGPGRRPAGDGVDPRRRLRDRHVQPPRVRRRPPRPRRRRRRGDVQLPRRHRGLRADRGGARQPGPARPGRRAGVGAGQHPGLRRRPRPGDGLRRVRGWRIGRRAAGDAPCGRAVRPGRRAERAGHVLLARARRRHRHGMRRRAGAAADDGRAVHGCPGPAVRRR